MGGIYKFLGALVFWGGLLAGVVLGALFLVIAVAMPAYFNPEPPKAAYETPATPAEAYKQDLDYLKHFLELDRSYTAEAKQKAEAIRQEMIAKAETLSKAELAIGIARMAALADNGHTNFNPAKRMAFGFLPVRVWTFEDGAYIIRTRKDENDLLGARLVSIEGRPIAEVLAALKPLYGGTDEYRRAYALLAIQAPAILNALGLAKSPDAVGFDVQLRDGRTETRVLSARPVNPDEPLLYPLENVIPAPTEDEFGEWASLLDPTGPLPLWLADGTRVLRASALKEAGGYYIQMKANDDYQAESMLLLTKNVKADVKEAKPAFIVLDMRFNGGGDYTTTSDLMRALPKLLPEARFYILTSNQTFSAGITSTVFLEGAAPERTTILGEMAGDRANFWSEGNAMFLPNSKFRLHYSTGFHSYDGHCGKLDKCYWLNYIFRPYAKSYAPDERIALTYADYLAGRDAVMDRVLALEAARKAN